MISSVISGNLTTIVVFIPFLLYMKELDWMGQMAKDMIFTIVIAIVSSLFVAIFLVPVLAGHYLPLTNTTEKPVRNAALKKLYDSFEKVIDKITEVYKKILYAALSHRKRGNGSANRPRRFGRITFQHFHHPCLDSGFVFDSDERPRVRKKQNQND